MADGPGVLPIDAVVVARGGSIGDDTITDSEKAVQAGTRRSFSARDPTAKVCLVKWLNYSQASVVARRGRGRVVSSIGYIYERRIDSLKDIVGQPVEAVTKLEIVLAPLGEGIGNVGSERLAGVDIVLGGQIVGYVGGPCLTNKGRLALRGARWNQKASVDR